MKNSSPIRYRDRETGKIETELIFGEKELRFLYEHPLGRTITNLALSREPLNRIYGFFQRTRESRRRIPEFIRRLGIDAREAAQPVDQYRTLDDFFTRKLRPDARPVDPNPLHLISPADGRTLAYPEVDGELRVKGSRVPLPDLLGDEALARRFQGGAAVVVRLAPADYHRFHFPGSGTASRARRIGAGLHSVHPVALEAGAPSFRNKRMITELDTEVFGKLLLVEVGALIVGTIVQTYRPGPVKRGQEKGLFRFGGSTVVLLAEPGRLKLDKDLVEAGDLETMVKVGTRIACGI